MSEHDEGARYEAEQDDYYYRKAQQEVADDHAAAVARLREAGEAIRAAKKAIEGGEDVISDAEIDEWFDIPAVARALGKEKA